MTEFAICTNNEGVEASLEVRKIYKVIKDKEVEKMGMLRVIDNSEEDYLHSLDRFILIRLEKKVEKKIFKEKIFDSPAKTHLR